MTKGFYPCLWLLHGKAVKGFDNDEVISEDPAALAASYVEAGADGLILFDRSKKDADHDAAIDLIRRICEENEVPVIGAGNIRRMEDVKKLIYAGCELAALNLSRESNCILAREVSERFGKDRIAGCYKTTESSSIQWDKLTPWISARILLDAENEAQTQEEAGAENVSGNEPAIPLPVISLVSDPAARAIAGQLSGNQTEGVSGEGVNILMAEGKDAVSRARVFCEDAGINMEQKAEAAFAWEDFKKGPDGLLPVVVQEEGTDQVLMVAYMNEEAYRLTVETGRMTYYSRSRKSLWIKGETSGHFQYVRSLYGDCDMDTLLARVVQIGAACHTGSHSCFFNEVQQTRAAKMTARRGQASDVLSEDYATIIERKKNPREGSYTNYLFDKGLDKMLKKLGEENTEIIIAAKNPGENEIIYEIADYLYHLEVVMAEKGVDWEDITRELIRRQKKG